MTEIDPRVPPDPSDDPEASSRGIMGRLRTYFLTGLIVAGPVLITLWLVGTLVTWVDDLVRPFIPVAYRPETYLPVQVPGTGLIVALVGLTLLGFLTANLVGRTLIEIGEWMVSRVPIIRPLYRGLKQIFETLFSKSGTSFRKVALIEFPSPGMWSLVFLSQAPGGDLAGVLPGQDDYVSVFLPCSPNPTTGFFFYVARKDLIEVEMNTEQAATLIMSAGMIQPVNGDQKKLSALAQAARRLRPSTASAE